MKVGPWQLADNSECVMRIREGGDPNNIADRVAFIEKTPRIRIRPYNPQWADHLNWAEAPFKGPYGGDIHSREWCDMALVLFGYEFDIV